MASRKWRKASDPTPLFTLAEKATKAPRVAAQAVAGDELVEEARRKDLHGLCTMDGCNKPRLAWSRRFPTLCEEHAREKSKSKKGGGK